jgi:hypothetical protein
MTLVAPTLQGFFTDRLNRQLQASPRTIASYRDTLRLLLCFTRGTTGKQPASLDWDDLNETLISAFLEHLETDRHNSVRTRNLRLTAIRSLFKYAALRHPEHANVIARVLSIPPKRHQKRTVTFLTAPEAKALIDAPTDHAGRAAATARCSPSRSRPGSASQSSSSSTAATSRSAPVRTSAAKAKAESNAPFRSPPPPKRSWRPGSPSEPADPQTRYFPPAPAADSAATPLSSASTPTPPQQQRDARPSKANNSTRTCCDTAARCHCCKPESTPP